MFCFTSQYQSLKSSPSHIIKFIIFVPNLADIFVMCINCFEHDVIESPNHTAT
jgi:hypothetical protein